MTTRVLPADEWPKLAASEMGDLWRAIPSNATVIVVERDGALVGCHVLTVALHAEALWIAPAHRGRAAVARLLWDAVKRVAKEHWGATAVVTAAVDDRVKQLLRHVQAQPLPGEHFTIPLEVPCQLPSPQ